MKLARLTAFLVVFSSILLLGIFGCGKDSPSEPVTDTTPPPDPTNMSITQEQLGLRLDWDIPLIDSEPVPDLKGYRVYREPGFSAAGKAPTDSADASKAPENGNDYIFALESNYFDRSVVEGGAYTYSVTAIDDSLNESGALESDLVVFDTKGPLVRITSPITGFVTNAPNLMVAGTVADSQQVGTASVYVNDTIAAQPTVDAAGAFSAQVSLEIGQNTLKAGATDPNGNVGVSSEVSVVYDTSGVVVQILSPEDASITREERVAVSGSVSDPSINQATLKVNGTETTIEVTGGQFYANAELEEGFNTIYVSATNDAGTTGTSAAVRVTRDTIFPVVYIVQPIDGTPFQESPILVSGTVADANPPDSVSLSHGGTLKKLILMAGQFQAWVELNEGTNQLTVSAIDLAGNIGSNSVTVYLNSYGPTVRITTPQNDALLNDPDIDVGGTVTDPNISSGILFVNGVPQVISIESGIFLVPVTLSSEGSNNLWVEVVDEYERPGVSDTVTVILDTTPPTIIITTPADSSMGNSPSISVAGQIDDEEVETVNVYVNDFAVEATVHDEAFSTQVTLLEGWNALYAKGTDMAGNTGQSSSLAVFLDTQAEISSVDHDAAGEILEIGDHVMFWVDAGEPNGTATIDIGDVHMGIELYDDGTHGDTDAGDGLYTRDYTIQAMDEASDAQVIGHFTDHVDNVALDKVADATITINVPPGAVTLFEPSWTDVSSSAVNLKWTASTSADFQDYRLYRDTSPGVNTLSTLVTTITDAGQDTVRYTDMDPALSPGSTFYYRVYVRDLLGASIASNEVSATLDNWPTHQKLVIPSGNYPTFMDRIEVNANQYVMVSHLTEADGQIRIINMLTDAVVKTLEVGGSTVGVANNPYREVLVAGFSEGKVYRVHGFDLDFTETPFDVGGNVWDVESAWGPGDTLYAFSGVGDSIVVMNCWTGEVDAKFYAGGGGRYIHLGASPDRNTIYAGTRNVDPGTIAIIDPMSWSITQQHGGFLNIQDMTVTENYIFLAHEAQDRVTVVNRWNMQQEQQLIAVGGPSHCMLLPGDRYLYVSCKAASLVRIFDTQSWQEIDRVSVATPNGMVTSNDGQKVYVTRIAWNGGIVVLGM